MDTTSTMQRGCLRWLRVYEEGVFPVIWSQNLAYGYGMPLFEFYAPLPYFLGAIFIWLIQFNTGNQIVDFLQQRCDGCKCISVDKYLFKDSRAALLFTAVLLFAPYRAVDLIRAAYSQLWAIAFYPVCAAGISMIIEKKKTIGGVCLSLSLPLFWSLTTLRHCYFCHSYCCTHWVLIATKRVLRKQVVSLLKLAGYGLLGIGHIGILFNSSIDRKTLYSDWHLYFGQLLQHSPTLSVYSPIYQALGDWGVRRLWLGSKNDEMSYFLGYPQLLILLVVLILTILAIKRRGKLYKLQVLGLILTMLSLLLTLLKTQDVWDLVSIAQYVQFPGGYWELSWSFSSALAGTSYLLFKKLRTKYFVLVLWATASL